ncbi:hypothetical protein DL96DRAFT_1586834, partial [Flagelloscypha sp. PMI_526]
MRPSADLPVELWQEILQDVSDHTLRKVQSVNRTVYEITQERLGPLPLNLVPWNSLDCQWKYVDSRLSKALLVPPRVRFIRLCLRPLSLKSSQWDTGLSKAIHNFKNVSRLSIVDRGYWSGDPSPAVAAAWVLWASQLTVLSLQLETKFIPVSEREVCLPNLRVFRVRIRTRTLMTHYERVHNFIRQSSYIEELEYFLLGGEPPSFWNQSWPSEALPLALGRLKVFKWSCLMSLNQNFVHVVQFPPFFTKIAHQLQTVHLNPATSGHINVLKPTGLTVLRTSIHPESRADDVLFRGLSEAGIIRRLQLAVPRLYPPKFYLMESLETLELAIDGRGFSPQTFRMIAEMCPNLHKLALNLFVPYGRGIPRKSALQSRTRIKEQFQAAVASEPPLNQWSLQDLSLFWNARRLYDHDSILKDMMKMVPSVSSLFGTGSRRLPNDSDIGPELFEVWKITTCGDFISPDL